MPHPTELAALTPVEIDTQLATIHTRLYRARTVAAQRSDSLERSRRSRWVRSEELVRAEELLVAAELETERIAAETRPYDREFSRRGGWTRAFLVTSSTDGHVHASTACSTCRPTTEFIWLPEYSGKAEEAIVDDAGQRACTTCYPTAPADVRARPTKVFSPAERQAAADRESRAAQRAERHAAQQAKAITNPDGSPLRVDGWGEVRTERTAQTLYVERRAEQVAVDRGLIPARYALYRESVPVLLAALAAKRDMPNEQVEADLAKKVDARVRRDYT